tara:strand:+ start:407 stop:715 length:309 start_codon:yes stop_codon:yes gene_type:complete
MIKVLLFGLILLLAGCGGVKDALTGKKKSATDEFLVEKKNPLVMPPEYGKLPTPITDKSNNNKKEDSVDEIKELLTNKDNVSVKNNQTKSTSLEKSILEKIK